VPETKRRIILEREREREREELQRKENQVAENEKGKFGV
jgi:hypothetical protein